MHPLKTRTTDEAIGRWPGILSSLGVDAQFLQNKHGPCPACNGIDRYRFDDKNGRGTWICSHCGSGDGFSLLQRLFGWDFKHAAKEVDRIVGTVPLTIATPERTDKSKLQALRTTWQASRTVIEGDPVWRYLHRRSGIQTVPTDLRFHPSLKHSDGGFHPAMLALMRYPDGTAASIHRTYLTDGGDKAAVSTVKKFMSGKPLNSACVRLSAPSSRMGIAEGIETALAASHRFDVPVWAATNATLLQEWIPPPGITHIVIAGDNDASCTGQAAAFALAKRLTRDGYAVEVQIPDVTGTDWADA